MPGAPITNLAYCNMYLTAVVHLSFVFCRRSASYCRSDFSVDDPSVIAYLVRMQRPDQREQCERLPDGSGQYLRAPVHYPAARAWADTSAKTALGNQLQREGAPATLLYCYTGKKRYCCVPPVLT